MKKWVAFFSKWICIFILVNAFSIFFEANYFFEPPLKDFDCVILLAERQKYNEVFSNKRIMGSLNYELKNNASNIDVFIYKLVLFLFILAVYLDTKSNKVESLKSIFKKKYLKAKFTKKGLNSFLRCILILLCFNIISIFLTINLYFQSIIKRIDIIKEKSFPEESSLEFQLANRRLSSVQYRINKNLYLISELNIFTL